MNIKRILSILLIIICILGLCPATVVSAEESKGFTWGNYTYEMYTSDSVIITGYQPTHEDTLKIPDKINGYPVVALAEKSLTHVWEDNVILPDTLEIIENNAFGNSDVKNLHISKSVKTIGTIKIEKSITVDKNNPYFKSVDGELLSKDGKTFIYYPCFQDGREYTVPNGVEYIADGAFYKAQYLGNVNLPEGLKVIGKEAFRKCIRLGEVHWPMSLEYVMDDAYADCEKLSAIYGYDNFYYVAPDAFENTQWYDKHPRGCVYLGSMLYSYKSTARDEEIVLAEGTTRIGAEAFKDRGPTKLTIPKTVVSIEPSAFFGGSDMIEIIVDEENPYFASVNGMLYDKEKKVLISIPRGIEKVVEIPDGTEVIYPQAGFECSYIYALVIPDSVYYVGDSAFEYCGWLTRAEFSGELDYLGDRAFFGDLNLEKVNLPGGDVFVGEKVFAGCSKLTEINVPDGCVAYGAVDFKETPWYNRVPQVLIENNVVLGYNSINKKLKELIVPDGAVAVGREAFANNSGLGKVVFSDTVTAIGDCAFENCKSLTEIEIPATVDEIGAYAFGFEYDKETNIHTKVEDFVIKGYTNSMAESYADAYGFEFVSLGYLEPESTLLGDLDCDGRLTVKDATAVQKYVAGMTGINTQDKINADFNCDGKINVRDATAIQKKLAHLI